MDPAEELYTCTDKYMAQIDPKFASTTKELYDSLVKTQQYLSTLPKGTVLPGSSAPAPVKTQQQMDQESGQHNSFGYNPNTGARLTDPNAKPVAPVDSGPGSQYGPMVNGKPNPAYTGPAVTLPDGTVAGGSPPPGSNIDPTIAGSNVRRYTGGTASPYQNELGSYYNNLDRAFTEEDESTIRRKQREGVQELLDNIRNNYASQIAQKQEEGKNITGAARSAAARTGTLGGDFGNAEQARARGVVAENVRAVEAERDAEISRILTGVNSRADELVESAKTKADANQEKYMTYLSGKQTESRTDATNLAKLGKNLKDLPADEYNRLLEQTGYSKEQLDTLFTLNKPEDKVLTSFTQGSKYYVVTQDPNTGVRKTETVDLGFEVPTDWKEAKVGDGIMFYNPADPKDNFIYEVAPSAKDQADLYNKQLNNRKLEAELKGGIGGYKFTNDDRGKLINSNLSQGEIDAIQQDVNEFGVEQVLGGITDEKQKAVIAEVLQGKAGTEKVSIAQVRQAVNLGKDAVSSEAIAQQLKNTYDNDTLEQLAIDSGYAWTRPVTDSDIADYLASPDAREKYIELIHGQYKERGMTND